MPLDTNVSGQVNIGDVLRLALPFNTSFIGDPSGMSRFVNWVTILTRWKDIEGQAEPNDLVIIPPSLMVDLEEQTPLDSLLELTKLPVAGCICFSAPSEELNVMATTYGLTILAAPDSASIRQIHQSIASLLLDRQTATSDRAIQLYRQLSAMSREGQGLAAMTDILSKLTGNIVAVQDKRLEIQAISWPANFTIDREAVMKALEHRDSIPPVLRNRKAAAKARQSYWQQLLPIEGSLTPMGRLLSPIISGDRARGYLSVIGHADQLNMFDSLAVEHGAAACALEMAKVKAVNEVRKALRGNFLEGLLTGSLPRREIERLEGRLDHNTLEPHAVLVVSWLGASSPSLRRLETLVHWVLSNHPRSALVHIYSNQHLVIFQSLKNETDMESAQQLGRRVGEQIEMEFPQSSFIGGASGPARNLMDWPAAYDEALQAMDLANRLNLTNQFVEFNSLGIYRLLYDLENLDNVRQFTDEVMRPLIEYDTNNHGNLIKTVEAYFYHHGNISQTAESLFIHRNTLLYRMDRVQELTGLQLDQTNMRLALHLALKLWQLRPAGDREIVTA